MKFDEIPSSMLAQAMETYLDVAYPHGQIPPYVLEMARMDASAPLRAALDRPRVERKALPGRPDALDKCLWRLGNDRYPHMKLGIERCSEADDFVFVVDTHDRDFPLGSPVPQSPEFRELLRYNASLKHAIEARWAKAGIPTFPSHLTDYLREHPGAAEPQPKTILVVEDDGAIRELEETLLTDAGYRVVVASGGAQALEIIELGERVDLCLLDIMMPSLDGIEVARRMRTEGHPRFPILYVTALPPDRTRDGVADGYIGKPFDPDHLLHAICRLIG
jgi:CheY-like chemotaxis protein